MPRYLHEGRSYIDPREEPVRTDDHVILSDAQIPWRVEKVAKDGSMVYLRSLSGWGKRFGSESTSRLRAAWRDPNYKSDTDWTDAYDVEDL